MNKMNDATSEISTAYQLRLFVVDPGHLAFSSRSADAYDTSERPDALGSGAERVAQVPRAALVDITDGTAGARPFDATLQADMERRGVALPQIGVITPVYEQTQL